MLMQRGREGFPIEEHMSTVTVFEALRKPSLPDFGEIFEEHYDLTYRTAYSITRSAQDAEDVVQTIFLRLLRRQDPPDLTRNPKGYFYRAAVNISLKLVRNRRRHVPADGSEDKTTTPNLTDGSEEEMDRRLWEAIAELNETAAQILILRYMHGYSVADIATLLGTSRSAIGVSLFRSRARLKKLIRASQGGNS
jgi:RNA polymerase sigma-70 factor (ECF subfamily)